MPANLRFNKLNGRRYFYCESTPQHTEGEKRHWEWSIGEVPFEGETRVTPVPIAAPISP